MLYQLQIKAANVPEALVGAPLSVEVISQAGYAQRLSLPLSDAPVVQPVDQPGLYLLRATLPSGRLISSTATAADQAGSGDAARGTAVLDFAEQDALSDLWREAGSLLQVVAAIKADERDKPLPPWIGARFNDLVGRGLGQAKSWVVNKLGSLRTLAGGEVGGWSAQATPDLPPDSTEAGSTETGSTVPVIGYEWSTFVRWNDTTPMPGEHAAAVVLRRGDAGVIDPSGAIAAPPLTAESDTPYYFKVTVAESSSLIVWLPGPRRRPAQVLVDRDKGAHRSGSALSATADPEDPITRMLFSYMLEGRVEETRVGLPALVDSLQREGDVPHPNRGVLAAYLLYKLGHPYAATLIGSLRKRYPKIADVHVLAAAQSIAAGQSDQAIEPAAAALRCGVPVYTEGVRMLREAASFLRDINAGQGQFREAAYRATCIAAAANFASQLTCLRIGNDLGMTFAND